jgi:ribonuclease HII
MARLITAVSSERRQKQKRSRADASKALSNKQQEKIFRAVLTKQKNPVYTARLR